MSADSTDQNVNPDTIAAASERIAGHIRRTPVMPIAWDNRQAELKLEYLQISGTFKARGAFNRLLSARSAGEPVEAVATASGGNHGIAVACAARALGITADVFVPEITPPAKRSALMRYGATVHVGGAFYADASAACQTHIEQTGALYCHAYDQPETLNGQGTVALEWEQQTAGLDTVLVAVGGGGLIGGIAAWLQNRIKVVAVESTGCATLNRALAAGKPVDTEVGGLAADSLGARQVGEWMFPIARQYVDASVLVSDDCIRAAQRFAWDECRIALEPGGATALAAWLDQAYQPQPDERVGILLCGANTAPPPGIAGPA
jgi:threonine dehydratase